MGKVREGHIDLPWQAYVAVGAIIAGIAFFVRHKNPSNNSMTLFLWIGVALLLWGIGKLAFVRYFKKEEEILKKEETSYAAQLAKQQASWQHQQQVQQQHPAQHNLLPCPKCGTVHYSVSNFCHRCGSRLK
jgi:ABC-type nickel/cobalt efflux system permease component RcnA